jgi:hypothetical protein|tara:strand:+ start:929 stop:1096 length:168 start_codon:yes stop_codon:yes gene_type:complete
VANRNTGNRTGWGALPPKAEARARNILDRNYPAHYRKAIDEYFKRLAERQTASRK